MNDSKPPDDNIISFDSFKKKEGSRRGAPKGPPQKRGPQQHSFEVKPGKQIECKIFSKTDGGYLVKVEDNANAFLSTDNKYDFGMIIQVQIVCEKEGYLLLTDEFESDDQPSKVFNLFQSNDNQEPQSESNDNCLPFKPNEKDKDDS